MSAVDSESAILVGIPPGGRVHDGTIAFALDAATHLDVGIELVHVVPMVLGGPTGTWDVRVVVDQLVAQGRAWLETAQTAFRQRAAGRVSVEATLLQGSVVATLVERSSTAQLVVLEHDHLGAWARMRSGSVTSSVAARAHSPVVSVPAGWRTRRHALPITAAVEDAGRAQSEVWTALGLAAVSDLPVRLLRVAYVSQPVQELLRREVDVDDLLLAARADLERDVDLPRSVVDRTPCTYEVRWGRPAEVLVEASKASSLLVIARRDPTLPFGVHLGPVVHQVLDHAECPVMVVEPSLRKPLVPARPEVAHAAS